MSTFGQARLVDPPIWTKEQAWERRGSDLTQNGKLSLSKALLGSCCLGKTGEDVYSSYFRPFTLVDADANLSCLKSRPDQERKIRNTMYNIREPTKDPGYFTFSSHADVNRLAKVIGKEIVIYLAHDRQFQFFEIYHDFRGFSQEQQPRPAETLYYVVTLERKLFKFWWSLDNLFEASPYFFGLARTRIYGSREDYGIILARLLNLPAPGFAIGTLLELAFCTDRLYQLWQKKILLVNFCKSTFNQRESKNASRRFHPRFSSFFNLGIIGPKSADSGGVGDLDLDTFDTAVCFYAETFACVLKEPYRLAVIEQYKQSSRRDKPSHNDFAGIPTVTLEEQRVALALAEAKKSAKKRRRGPERREKICECNLCSSDTFSANMENAGPERLCSYFLDLSDLLKLLGLDSPDNVAAVERMCELSVASMDIESMTVQVDLEPPVKEVGGLAYGTVDSASLEGHLKKVQKPLMIAHMDETLKAGGDVTVFQIESDAEESIYKMMREYWAFVKSQQWEAIKQKRELAAPLLAVLQDYKTVHFEVYFEWCRDNNQEYDRTSISGAWRASLPGQLEKRLLKLVSDYTVFSFYG